MTEIRTHREKADLSQTDLAVRCGWFTPKGRPAQTRIANYESGERTPTLEDCRKIVSALNEAGVKCSLNDVFPPSQEDAA